jgi:hypothetical protein
MTEFCLFSSLRNGRIMVMLPAFFLCCFCTGVFHILHAHAVALKISKDAFDSSVKRRRHC